ncbi:hypothetical protein Geob_0992 [Geotalea daltonii FRC-32]|uniref:Uncharacterized protein n=1 Tax=Geotalea daltonii (strain DSM 22248 / JCM 15807 / FRC-32) TaxID=316067 RepID=B9M2H5_GEODF|nr:hypothetical protein [Geotalea daltonii]ACM19354.1 hypothetical protein Geob_0992 [Geotalea daltonii FRC-32]
MKSDNPRKFAAMMSVLSAVGNVGAVAIIINAAGLREFMAIAPTSPKIMFLLVAGFFSLGIAVALLVPTKLSKKSQLIAVTVSITIFILAAVQMSMVLIFVLLWPWSLYKFYKSEAA